MTFASGGLGRKPAKRYPPAAGSPRDRTWRGDNDDPTQSGVDKSERSAMLSIGYPAG